MQVTFFLIFLFPPFIYLSLFLSFSIFLPPALSLSFSFPFYFTLSISLSLSPLYLDNPIYLANKRKKIRKKQTLKVTFTHSNTRKTNPQVMKHEKTSAVSLVFDSNINVFFLSKYIFMLI